MTANKVKPNWFKGSQKEWDKHIASISKTYVQRSFSYHTYIKDSENIQKIQHFVKCIEQGELPDDDTLSWISDNFNRYLNKKVLTLDSAFGMKSKPKGGNPIDQFNTEVEKNVLLNRMAEIIVTDNISQVKAAEIVLREYDDTDLYPKTLARYFRDWPTKKYALELYTIKARRKADK